MRGARSLVDRMIRAAKLDVGLYEEVEADTTGRAIATCIVGFIVWVVLFWVIGDLRNLVATL